MQAKPGIQICLKQDIYKFQAIVFQTVKKNTLPPSDAVRTQKKIF